MCPKKSLKNGCIFFFGTLISVFLSQIVKLSSQKNVEIYVFVYRILAGCAQWGAAWRRLPLPETENLAATCAKPLLGVRHS